MARKNEKLEKISEEVSKRLKMASMAIESGSSRLFQSDVISAVLGEEKNFAVVLIDEIEVADQVRERESVLEDIDVLAESIKRSGVIQPVVVEERKGKYLLVAGERRLTAARKAGLVSIPAVIVRNLSEPDRILLQLTENLQKKDLKPSEKGRAVLRMFEASTGIGDPEQLLSLLRRAEKGSRTGFPSGFLETLERIMKAVGVSVNTLVNWIMLITLPGWVIEKVDSPDSSITLRDVRRLKGAARSEDELRRLIEAGERGKRPRKKAEEDRVQLRRKIERLVERLLKIDPEAREWLKGLISSK